MPRRSGRGQRGNEQPRRKRASAGTTRPEGRVRRHQADQSGTRARLRYTIGLDRTNASAPKITHEKGQETKGGHQCPNQRRDYDHAGGRRLSALPLLHDLSASPARRITRVSTGRRLSVQALRHRSVDRAAERSIRGTCTTQRRPRSPAALLMPFRLYHRAYLIPGVSLNVSTSGPSLSFCVRGAHVTVGKRGVERIVGIPGTGVYWTDRTGRHTGVHYHAQAAQLDGLSSRLSRWRWSLCSCWRRGRQARLRTPTHRVLQASL
jgi:hypothetical protein